MLKQGVSLVTTVYNEGDNILGFLNSYKNQTVFADEFIIVDGGSIDNTEIIIQEFAHSNPNCRIRLIIDKTSNKKHTLAPIAKGRNVAIEAAKYDIIAVTDAGCILTPDWLEKITLPFGDDPAIDVVAGFYDILERNDFEKRYGYIFIPRNHNFLPSSRSVAFKKRCWRDVGGYPTTSYTAEDTLLMLKFKEKKFNFIYQPGAVVNWIFAKNLADLKKKLWMYGQGEGLNMLYFTRFLYRLISVIFPPFLLAKKISAGKKIPLNTLWMFYKNHSWGYIDGLKKRIMHAFEKNI